MANKSITKNVIGLVIGVLSLFGLLSYTFVHTGSLLASYVNPAFIGFLAAFGIEMSIVGLSMRIGELKKSGLSYRFFAVTLIAVVIVSAVANASEGFHVRFGEPLTLSNFGNQDVVQLFVSVAATVMISIVTLALSEIVGQDVIHVQKIRERNEKREVSEGEFIVSRAEPPKLPAPIESRIVTDEEFKIRMDEMGDSAPKSVSDVEAIFHLSHATAQRRLSKYRGGKS